VPFICAADVELRAKPTLVGCVGSDVAVSPVKLKAGSVFTVNPLKAVDVTEAAVTERVLVPVAAPDAIVMLIGTLVAVTGLPIVAVTPVPLKVTFVVPVRFVPVIVAATVLPCTPDEGEIAVIFGGGFTVKPLKAGDVPNCDIMLIVLCPKAALEETEIVMGTLVAVIGLPTVAVTPVPLKETLGEKFRFRPLIVAANVAPCDPDVGVMAVIVGT
jgi:hypothetical protein